MEVFYALLSLPCKKCKVPSHVNNHFYSGFEIRQLKKYQSLYLFDGVPVGDGEDQESGERQ